MIDRVFFFGTPGSIGGAATELWHTLRLFREQFPETELTLIPAWEIDQESQLKCEAMDAAVDVAHDANGLAEIEGLAGATVISLATGEFWNAAPTLRKIKCKLVWLNCMCWLSQQELSFAKTFGPCDCYVFQSNFQRDCLAPRLQQFGADNFRRIRGAFYPDQFPYGPRPHAPDTEFYVGTLCRPDPQKLARNHWQIYAGIPYAKLRPAVMGWDSQMAATIGQPPTLSQAYPAGFMTSQAFLASLHAMIPTGTMRENWPRIALEAMAAGVPIIARNHSGWGELLADGAGILCKDEQEMAYKAAWLAYNEPDRIMQADRGLVMVRLLSDPDAITADWKAALESL